MLNFLTINKLVNVMVLFKFPNKVKGKEYVYSL